MSPATTAASTVSRITKTQWQGKAALCRVSCAALCTADNGAKPTKYTKPSPRIRVRVPTTVRSLDRDVVRESGSAVVFMRSLIGAGKKRHRIIAIAPVHGNASLPDPSSLARAGTSRLGNKISYEEPAALDPLRRRGFEVSSAAEALVAEAGTSASSV